MKSKMERGMPEDEAMPVYKAFCAHHTHESPPATSPHVPHSRSMEERASEACNYSDKSPPAHATLHSLNNSLECCYKFIYKSKVKCLL